MRQFVSAVAPNSKGLLEITGKDFHYLRNVLRLQVGDMAPVSVPGGALLQSTVCKVDDARKKITLQVCASPCGQNDSQAQDAAGQNSLQAQEAAVCNSPAGSGKFARTPLALLQFIPKPQKMELIVRQATECGVAAVIPVIGEYTQAGSEKALQKSDRFERIVREARQQSGSQVETKIYAPQKLQAALDLLERADFWRQQNFWQAQEVAAAKIVLYERSERTVPLAAALFGLAGDCSQAQEAARSPSLASDSGSGDSTLGAGSSSLAIDSSSGAGSLSLATSSGARPAACVFAIGSEGGISPAEYELLLERGFKAVHFNTNILRCETAALYAAAAIQSALDN